MKQKISIALIALGLLFPPPLAASSRVLKFDPPLKATSGSRQGVDWVNYIHEIRIYSYPTGETRKTNYVRYSRVQRDGSTDRTFGSWEANCGDSTLDGKLVPARARYGYEIGAPEILALICDAK